MVSMPMRFANSDASQARDRPNGPPEPGRLAPGDLNQESNPDTSDHGGTHHHGAGAQRQYPPASAPAYGCQTGLNTCP